MQRFCKRNFSRSAATWLLTLLLALGVILPAQAAPDNRAFARPVAASLGEANDPSHAFTFDQIGAEVDKQSGQASTVIATASGATVRAPFQALVGALTSTGLWLRSTAAAKHAGTSPTLRDLPFRVQASAIGRGPSTVRHLASTGTVTVANGLARWRRPGVVEEYSASTDGVRQDFLLLERPGGQGALRLELTVAGATLHRAADGVRLQLNATGRTLAYHRLQVSDAQGQQLPAHMQVLTPTRLAIVVDEAGAAAPVTWPLRIDPTFSDANWLPLGDGIDNVVRALAVIGSDLYVGGNFSTAGGVSASNIAKWDGTTWSALGDGLDSNVFALAVSGSDLYVGGDFTTAGGVSASAIAKWDGSSWSALGTGLDTAVLALAVVGSDLYVGGVFSTAGGGSASNIAKWDGTTWSALGSGLNDLVTALALSGSDLYVGGGFTTAGVSTANGIAKAQLLSAQLAVTGQGVSIPSGATTPSSSDDTDFGSVTLGSPVVHTFTLHNNGSAALTVSAIDSSGGDASDFVSSGLPLPATIAAGSSATFNVTFTPGAAGLRTTTLTISSDDPNTPSYTFALQGTGSTPVPPAQITIVLDTQPDSPTNLGFSGSLGAFLLDDPASDDGDAYSNSQTFSVAPGAYTVRRNTTSGWFLTDITCTPSGQASLNLFQRRATITVASGDSVTCTYTVQHAATIRARAFNDLVRTGSNLGKRNAGDPWLNGWAMRVYSAPNALVANDLTGATSTAGLYQASFTTLRPGSYTICTTLPDNAWTPSAPSTTDPNYANQPCKPVTLAPGQVATVLFGAYQPPFVASEAFTPADELVTDADTIVDQPYDPAEDETATAEESRPRLFLPLIVR